MKKNNYEVRKEICNRNDTEIIYRAIWTILKSAIDKLNFVVFVSFLSLRFVKKQIIRFGMKFVTWMILKSSIDKLNFVVLVSFLNLKFEEKQLPGLELNLWHEWYWNQPSTIWILLFWFRSWIWILKKNYHLIGNEICDMNDTEISHRQIEKNRTNFEVKYFGKKKVSEA